MSTIESGRRTREPTPLTRRGILQWFGIGAAGVAGAGALGALDGCAQGGSGRGKTSEFTTSNLYQLPPTGHYNVMNGVLNGILAETRFMDLLCPRGAFLLWASNRYEPLAASTFGFDTKNRTYRYALGKGMVWSDGKPVTAKDVAATFWCRRIMRQSEWQYFDGLEVEDDQTVVFHMSQPSTVVEYYVLSANIYSASTYGEIGTRAQRLFAAGKNIDDPEGKAINDALQKLRPENIVTFGPYHIDTKSVTNAQLTMVKQKNGLRADKMGFDRVVVYRGETNDVAPLVAAKKIDYATNGFSVAQEKSFLRKGISILRPATYAGPAIYVNFDRSPELKDPRARQAFAHAIDRKQNGTFSLGPSGKGVERMVGFSELQIDQWMLPEAISKLDPYAYDQDKAARLLESIGWKRSAGKWQLPNGKPAHYEISYQSDYADYAPAGKNVAEQLGGFGIDVAQRGVVSTQLLDDTYKGNFDLVTQGWGAGNPHPSFAYVTPFLTYNYPIAVQQGGRGIDFPLHQVTRAYGKVDIQQLVKDAGLGLDRQRQKERISQLAVIFNELLPVIPLFERFGNNACLENVRAKGWPKPNDSLMKNGPYNDNFVIILMYRGQLRPV